LTRQVHVLLFRQLDWSIIIPANGTWALYLVNIFFWR